VTFLSAAWLWLLVPVALLAGAYVHLQRQRRHHAVRFTNLELLASVAPRRPGWRRHVPAAITALALVSLVVALARPAHDERVPKQAATIMLAIDVSGSMNATDVSPTRLDAARSAAVKFVDGLPDRLKVGLVAFSDSPRLLVPPTTDGDAVKAGLKSLTAGGGTAAGEGIETALVAIANAAPGVDVKGSAAIVLLSDGASTLGRPVESAAQDAKDDGVPVNTIVYGTADGTVEVRGEVVPVPPDPDTMRQVAETTGGTSFEAASASQLRSVYEDIGRRVGFVTEQREIGMRFVAVGVVLLMVALAGALVWSARML
jgi:Ca-activated chloride channel family protein